MSKKMSSKMGIQMERWEVDSWLSLGGGFSVENSEELRNLMSTLDLWGYKWVGGTPMMEYTPPGTCKYLWYVGNNGIVFGSFLEINAFRLKPWIAQPSIFQYR